MYAQLKPPFLLFLVLYMDAVLAFLLAVTTDCLLVLLLNIPVIVVLYSLVGLLSRRWHKSHL